MNFKPESYTIRSFISKIYSWYPMVRGGTRVAYHHFGYLHPEVEV